MNDTPRKLFRKGRTVDSIEPFALKVLLQYLMERLLAGPATPFLIQWFLFLN